MVSDIDQFGRDTTKNNNPSFNEEKSKKILDSLAEIKNQLENKDYNPNVDDSSPRIRVSNLKNKSDFDELKLKIEYLEKKIYTIDRLLNNKSSIKEVHEPTSKKLDRELSIFHKLDNQSWIANKTLESVNNHLKKNDQVLFFINRRGFAPYALCKKCLNVYSCPNCSINLVYHKHKNKLLCHYCGFQSQLSRNCKKGEVCDFVFSGPGVERISEEVKLKFPNNKISIFSSDTMNKKSSKKKLEDIVKGKIDILIGTQLISKGFHFPKLNCIVILDIDLNSNGHDLRTAEKNLQLYHQLSGRAGRTGKPAKVYFQTYNSNQSIINQITNPDPFIFLENELKLREKNNLPPFERFISLILTSSNERSLEKESMDIKNILSESLNEKILGPVNAPIYRVRRKYRQRLLIRSKKGSNIQKRLSEILITYKLPKEIKLTVDVDPITFN